MNTFSLAKFLNITCKKNIEISSIVTSTKDVTQNCVLLLVKGKIDPETLLNAEIIRKCALILSDNPNSKHIYIHDLKSKVFDILYFFYFPNQHHFRIIGITGTEGKSSLSDIIYQGLKISGLKCKIIATEKRYEDVITSKLTTPNASDLIKAMLSCEKENMDYLILEISSIGICEKRVNLQIFDYLFLTNLEEDHLDYHHNIYSYHMSKLSLFLNNKKAVKFIYQDTYQKYKDKFNNVSKLKIINEDDINSIDSFLDKQTFIYLNDIFSSELIFKQNRINLVFLIELLKELKINPLCIINQIKRVKGRLDLISKNPYIMIDYAHSPKSFFNVLKEVYKVNKSIILVFGSGGEREIEKRAKYGEYALKYARKIILTNDNPRNEDPYNIIEEIKQNRDGFEVILNRKKAIEKAIKCAKKDDIVLILGRGNEEYQLIKNQRIKLNDYEIVEEILKRK